MKNYMLDARSPMRKLAALLVAVAAVAALCLAGCGEAEEQVDRGLLQGLIDDVCGVAVVTEDDDQVVRVSLDVVDGEEWTYEVSGKKGALSVAAEPETKDGIWSVAFGANPKKHGTASVSFIQRYPAGAQEVAREYFLTVEVDEDGKIVPEYGQGYRYPSSWCWLTDGGILEINLPNQEGLTWSIEPEDTEVIAAELEPIDENGVTAAAYAGAKAGKTNIHIGLLDSEGQTVSEGFVAIEVGKSGAIEFWSNGWMPHK